MILKICALGVLCAVTYVVLGQVSGHFAVALRIAGTVMALTVGITLTADIIAQLLDWEAAGPANEYITLLLRALGICFLCRISADICKDCGITTLSQAIESVGKIVLVLMSIPYIAKIVDYARLLIDRI